MVSCKQCGAGIRQYTAASNVCKGQGSLYANRGSDSVGETQIFPPPSPDSNWTFQGCYSHMCCYCALRSGLHPDSFLAIGCYHCKERKSLALVAEFAKLRLQSSAVCLWAGLSGDLIDKIMRSVIDPKDLAPVTFSLDLQEGARGRQAAADIP